MREKKWRESGQASVEYMLVVMAFLAIVVALAHLWHTSRDGVLLRRATAASSHQLGGDDALGSIRDVSLF